MKYFLHLFISVLFLSLAISCSENTDDDRNTLSFDITPDDIEMHIQFLAADSLKGREAGTAEEARAANYIADHFTDFGLTPAGDDNTFFQQFTINMAQLNNPHQSGGASFEDEERIARNVIGLLEGTEHPDEYIIIGAHYDHLGYGKFGSLYDRDTTSIHNGADDNASGTAGLLELAQYFSRQPPNKSLLFIAFSGEEMGLLGSQHFVENPTVDLDNAVAMLNMDMIGRLTDNNLLIFGTGSSDSWEEIINSVNSDSLNIDMVPDGTGASDHTSFYNRDIPVLHYFTDTHADYHRPSDDPEYINTEGQDVVLEHLRRLIQHLDRRPTEELAFTEAPTTQNRNMTMSGVTLGVTPDYGFDGEGMRITGVSGGGAAEQAGLQSGDIIIALDGQPLGDIYTYMEVLNKLEEGQQTTVTVNRDGKEQTFNITF